MTIDGNNEAILLLQLSYDHLESREADDFLLKAELKERIGSFLDSIGQKRSAPDCHSIPPWTSPASDGEEGASLAEYDAPADGVETHSHFLIAG